MSMQSILYVGARLIAAIILLQTLYFKFTASPESVYIFTSVGMEPWGRIAVGILELIAGVMLVISATAWLGGMLALGLMGGALMMHLTKLGISVQGDGGYLFFLAVAVAFCSLYVVIKNKDHILTILKRARTFAWRH
jgi:putative oxidoreductase